jgi:hypothetical protein
MDWWDHWCEYHCSLFGWQLSRHADTFLAWQVSRVFEGFSYDEMRAGSAACLKAAPRFPGEHPKYVREAILAARLQGSTAAPDPGPDACPRCGGCGLVEVPALDAVRKGAWGDMTRTGRRRYSVRCPCPNGSTRYPARLGLEEYEDRNPGWRDQMRAEREHLDAQPGDGPLAQTFARMTRKLQGGEYGHGR